MSKLLSILIATAFATVSVGSFAASHGGAAKDAKPRDMKVEMKRDEKKMEKKEEKKEMKKEEKKEEKKEMKK